jgi:sialic acid synthase
MKRLDKGVGKISSFNILNYKVSHDSKCFIIAEIGHNHQGNLDTCIEMFKSAKLNGADAVKLQKRENKSLYSSETYNAIYNSENSYGRTYGEHREFLEFQKSDYEVLIQVANDLGIVFFATAFDIPSADFLMELDMPAFKIASGDLRSVQLLEYCSKFQKPMIISTGASEMKDVSRAVDLINGINTNLAILQCTAEYPANYSHLDLRIIQEYSTMFPNNVIGYSGHENGIAMPLAAFALGARIIEKHFTLDRTMKGTDHAFSLEPTGLRKLRRDLDRLHLALGDGVKKIYEEELAPLHKMSKKIVAKTFIEKNQVIKSSDIDFKIANTGLWPYQTEEVIGKRARNIIDVDSIISTNDTY